MNNTLHPNQTDDTTDDTMPLEQDDVTEQEAVDDTPSPTSAEDGAEEDEVEEEKSPLPKAVIQPDRNPKSPIGVMMFSLCLMGGVGHIYLGQKRKGIFIIILALLLSCVGLDFPILILGAIDAFVIARRLQQRRPVGLWEWFFNRRKPRLLPFPDDEETIGEDEAAETQDQPPSRQAQPVPPPQSSVPVSQQQPLMMPLVPAQPVTTIPVIPVTPAPQPPPGNQEGGDTGGEG